MSRPAKLEPAFKPALPGPEPRELVYRLVRKESGWTWEVFRLPANLLDGEKPIRSYGPNDLGMIQGSVVQELIRAAEDR